MINRFILIITTIFCLSLLLGKVFASTAKSDVKIPLPTGLSKDTQFIFITWTSVLMPCIGKWINVLNRL